MLGPGKYNELCTLVRERTRSAGVILIVIGGEQGSGMSCQLTEELTAQVPAILRKVADDIEETET